MLPGMELMGCQDLAVPREVMHHVVGVESGFNPYAIGVVGGRLVRQPRSVAEALATARDLEARGYNFSLGLAQVNRHNLRKYGLSSYEKAFESCPNLQAGARILAECHARSGGDWGKSFSCYYSGNFVTGFRHGYVQKVFASMQSGPLQGADSPPAIAMAGAESPRHKPPRRADRDAQTPAGEVTAAPALLARSESPLDPSMKSEARAESMRAETPRQGASVTVAGKEQAVDAAFVF